MQQAAGEYVIMSPVKVVVNVEELEAAQAVLNKINKPDLENIAFHKDGKEIEVPKEVVKGFVYCGLNNTDFVLSGYINLKKWEM